MTVIGLCGGSGSGKSVVAGFFSAHGVPVFDCDHAYHDITSRPTPCMKELTDTFGQGIENPDGSLNRPKLSEIVFSEHPPVPDALHRLNTITHRYVKETFSDWCTEQGRSGYSVVLIDAPLLFEAGIDRDCAVTIAVDCPTETRVKRIMKRDGITREAALRRIRAQISGEELCRKCDYSIENTGTLEETKKQLAVLLQNLYKRGILS